ncbi:pyruvate dehydrogenase E1 component alpha subunit [Austwickia chelonae]|uniref:Putative branched-chain alpha-keto acid dehydrogenase E1 alpha subunit n=1 Tax=Austwickia chelonae NBRC 105200 TaxID=1184607 RepID=K6VSX9_9MICO|nr:pyruvate dehydrogenase (acetyl-transferring) E1 component subunit alpha [Austwickia chelonae]GAB78450.1 putative branched-chain alpha-keto acid dehydrogenase E1 alpha subunit [Austwickia chelonae NBRC 105200]SEW39679.1 pyruvate dehydrogenase E1 component alpha subunit [Austwickia chelonae]
MTSSPESTTGSGSLRAAQRKTSSVRAGGAGRTRRPGGADARAARAATQVVGHDEAHPPFQAGLIPAPEPVRFLDERGERVAPVTEDYAVPDDDLVVECYRRMVVGRRFDVQATALTKQGRLAVYPSSRGQEACQVGSVLSIREDDWFFPTYRDSVALVSRGLDPVEVLTLLRGDAHCGYDPVSTFTAPQCTPLSTQLLHAAGVAYGERRQGRDRVALAFIGDGATSEGDFHEALNFAAVFKAPVVFVVQNNGWAISVPLSKQTAAPSLAYKGIGYGAVCEQVDGNDAVAVLAVVGKAVDWARAGKGPVLVELHTYRMEAHTNADDATRYRTEEEVEEWSHRDPVVRVETYLRSVGRLDDESVAAVAAEGEVVAAELRDRMNVDPQVSPESLFEHVYAVVSPQLVEQRELVLAEIAAEQADAGDDVRKGR